MIALRLLPLLALAAACNHGDQRPAADAKQAAKTKIFLRVTTDDHTNGGSTLYGVVRAMDAKIAPAAESYQSASDFLFAVPPDPTVLNSYPIIPGHDSDIVVETAPDGALLLYFFFSQPGARWRIPVQAPLPKSLVVRLGENDVAEISEGTGR